MNVESRKTIDRQLLTGARIEALEPRKLRNDAVAYHPLSCQNANPEAVHPPERTDAITLSRSRCSGTMKPSVKPGATLLETVNDNAGFRRERGKRFAALVYVAAFQPEMGENLSKLAESKPVPDAKPSAIRATEDGYLYLGRSTQRLPPI